MSYRTPRRHGLPPRVTPEQWAEARRLYRDTDTPVTAIAATLKRRPWTVYMHMAARGIHRKRGGNVRPVRPGQPRRLVTPATEAAIIRDYRADYPWEAICQRNRVSQFTVARIRIKHGLSRNRTSVEPTHPQLVKAKQATHPTMRRYRCECGAMSLSAVCPNGHRINAWIAA